MIHRRFSLCTQIGGMSEYHYSTTIVPSMILLLSTLSELWFTFNYELPVSLIVTFQGRANSREHLIYIFIHLFFYAYIRTK